MSTHYILMILFALCKRVTAEHSTVELQVASTGPETAKNKKTKNAHQNVHYDLFHANWS